MKGVGILAVDVGTHKVCALVGEIREDGLWVTGVGVVPALGIRRGLIIDITEATKSISKAIKIATSQAKVNPADLFVYVTVAGKHISMFSGEDIKVLHHGEVTLEDYQELIERVQTKYQSEEEVILHALPKEFIIDKERGIKNPIEMTGKKLQVYVNLITCSSSVVQNLVKCFETIGLSVSGVVFQGIASATAVLTEEEKDLGVLLIDFGAGTTDVVVYWDKVLVYAFSLPIGGDLVTNDLAIGLRTPKNEAERLKKEKGVCLKELVTEDEIIEVPGIGNRPERKVSKEYIAEIIEARVTEILELVERELLRFMVDEKPSVDLRSKLGSGIVITGGSAELKGLINLVDQMFDLPAKKGIPSRLNGLGEELCSPQFAAAIGLLLYAKEQIEPQLEELKGKGFFDKIKEFFKGLFKS